MSAEAQNNFFSHAAVFALPSGSQARPRARIAQKAAGVNTGSVTYEYDGTALTNSPFGNVQVNIGTGNFVLGSAINSSFNKLAMKLSFVAGFASVVSGADLIALRDEMRFHCLPCRIRL